MQARACLLYLVVEDDGDVAFSDVFNLSLDRLALLQHYPTITLRHYLFDSAEQILQPAREA